MFFAQRKHIILEAELAQQGFDNLLYILILINPAVGAFIKEPQPGYNLGLVTIEAPLLKAGVDKALHIAIQVARGAAGGVEEQGNMITHNIRAEEHTSELQSREKLV